LTGFYFSFFRGTKSCWGLATLLIALLVSGNGAAQMYTYVTPTTTGNSFPLSTTSSNKCQFLYLPSYFPTAPAGSLTKIYIRSQNAVTTSTWNNLTVKMGTTNLTAFVTGAFETALTTVYTAPVTTTTAPIPAGGWFELTLQTPFMWNRSNNLIVEISQTSYTGGLTIAYSSAVAGARHYGAVTSTTGTAGAGLLNFGFDLVTTPCAGVPVPGTIVSTPAIPCPGTSASLRLDPGNLNIGITYQWEEWDGTGWIPVIGGTGATGPLYTTPPITGPKRYRVMLTCTNGTPMPAPAYAREIALTTAPFISCYCIPTYATGAAANTITNVTLNTLNNTSTGAAPWYVDYTSQQPATIAIPTLTIGVTDTVIIRHSTNATNFSGVWIDFDHSGIFEPTEFFTLGTNAGASSTVRIPILAPAGTQQGLTRMRIRGADRGLVVGTVPCGPTATAFGEAEDYLVNIQVPPCAGPVNPGKVEISDTATCVGYTVDLWDTTHEYQMSRMSWVWERSATGSGVWTMIPGSENRDSLKNVPITGAVLFRVKMKCDNTGDSTYSNIASVKINMPYACYCYSQSNGGESDSSDIGSVVIGTMINTTGGPHVDNATAIRRRTDYTAIPNIEMNANNKYRLAIFHTQRNGRHADARVSVFVDYDNNLAYDVNATPNSELVYSDVTRGNYFYLDTVIDVPDVVVPNVPTGLRVILNNDLNPLSPANLGCGPYVSGETEDYVVMFKRIPQHVGGVGIDYVSLYPNPSNGKFIVSVGAPKNMGDIRISVTSITGQQILNTSYQAAHTKFIKELDLGNVAKGVYFVEVNTVSGARMVQKLIVQ
jgi:hypothetical protein